MTTLLNKGFARIFKKTGAPLIAKATPKASKKAKVIKTASRTSKTLDTWAVQVGAFSKISQARNAAEKAIGKASRYLNGGNIRIVKLNKRSGKILHRARIVGISKRDAYRTCRVLKDCMELRTASSPELASRIN